MSSASPSYPLSPLDHLAIRVHVPKLLYFKTPKQDPWEISKTLRDALDKTLAILPIFAGTLHYEDGAARKGTLTVQGPWRDASTIILTSDHGTRYDYEDLEARQFPPDGINWEATARTVYASSPIPVLLVHVNIIVGGVVLFVGVHHCVVDEIGIVNLLRVWSTFCGGGDGAALVKEEWFDRLPLKYGRGWGRPEDHPQYTIAPEENQEDAPLLDTISLFVPKETVQTAILFFSDAALAALKCRVLESIVSSQQQIGGRLPPEWVSTNDALCAFLWASVSAARLSADPSPKSDDMSTFRMTMDFRLRMEPPISAEYCGNLVMTAFANAKISSIAKKVSKTVETADPSTAGVAPDSVELVEPSSRSDLATAALTIRASYNSITSNTVYDVIEMVNNISNLHRCKPTGGYESHNAHLAITSWARQPYYDMNWGPVLGGRCRRLRGRNAKTDGCMAIFPRIPDGVGLGPGGIEVLLPLERSHLLWLRQDKAFNEYAEWRCVAGEPLEESMQGQTTAVGKILARGSWLIEWMKVIFQGGKYAHGQAGTKGDSADSGNIHPLIHVWRGITGYGSSVLGWIRFVTVGGREGQ